jgi:phosphoribosylanthranilate isomerase
LVDQNTNPIKIKICGLKSAEAAIVASDAGADYLGFNFVEGVRRELQPEEGIQIIADYRSGRKTLNRPAVVGLFRNRDPEFVNDLSRKAGLDYLQLCGNEDADYISKIELPIFKMVRVKDGTSQTDLDHVAAPLLAAHHGVLLDTYDKNTPGGSGHSFDWNTAEGIANRQNVLLAGGLTPENVQSAIRQLDPWGVDVASGVETDGVKDPDLIRAFIKAARSA